MSKYNDYAKQLDAAFKKAAEKQQKAYTAYTAAEEARKKDPYNLSKTDASKAAKRNLDAVQRSAWAEFQKQKDSLTSKLTESIRRDNLATASDFDPNVYNLLNVGELSPDDLEGLAAQYSGNPTMSRLIGTKAARMAEEASDPDARMRLNVLSRNCRQKKEPEELKSWQKLTEAADHYSGCASHASNPGLICNLNNHWNDDNVRSAIEEF